ncbi:MAG: gliding motility lipoprotein GldH [Sediminibacterium sp.]|nr:gliding motility lipoprotein GldH [Sediminibacterium sp.]
MIKKEIKPFAALVVLLIVLTGCKNNTIFSKYETFAENEWQANNKVTFKVNVVDSINLHDIYLMVRHAESYPYSNLFLFVTTRYPDGKELKDTMELILANQKGEWLGDGAGEIYDYRVPVKKNIRFARGGEYQFSFEQGMRVDPLPLIMDFGFEIEKSPE